MTAADPEPPTVKGLCEQWVPLSVRFALKWCRRHPHLEGEFKSAANYALFRAARSYVSKGAVLWDRMRFPVWLAIIVHRACVGVVAKEMNRHPVGFAPQPADDEEPEDVVADRSPEPGAVLAEAEQLDVGIGWVVELFDALYALKAEDQELVLRHFIDGVTIADLAREAGRPHSTIQTRIARAVRWLRFAAGTEETP